jgi:polysaccharide export outer membrane protein
MNCKVYIFIIFFISACINTAWCASGQFTELSEYHNISADSDNYRLGPGDVININVNSIPEISCEYTVSEAGFITFPRLLSHLKVQGMDKNELQGQLTEIIAEYMYNPKVNVRIIEHHSHKILVLGAFNNPGKYELKREKVPLLEIITEAGGLKDFSGEDKIVILRNSSPANLPDGSYNTIITDNSMESIQIDLQALLRDGDLTQNPMIQAGDVIYLASFFETDQYVYVTGGREKGAGVIPYRHGLTAFKALLKAGIVPDDPQTLELIIIRGKSYDDQRFINARLTLDPSDSSPDDIKLAPDDIIILPKTNKHAVYITGEVYNPGAATYRDGLTVLQAILEAGGMTDKALGSKVRILRGDTDGRRQIPVDMKSVIEKGDKLQNIVLKLGDIIVVPGRSVHEGVMVTGKVNNPGMIPHEEGITAIKAIFMAGGLKDNVLKSQARIIKSGGDIGAPFLLDMSESQIPEAERDNPVLEQGDLLAVLGTASGNTISVLGKVLRPGIIEYENGLTVLKAILLAGGFDRGASPSKVRIIRTDGEQKISYRINLENLLEKGDSSQDITLSPGDIVIVPETFF